VIALSEEFFGENFSEGFWEILFAVTEVSGEGFLTSTRGCGNGFGKKFKKESLDAWS